MPGDEVQVGRDAGEGEALVTGSVGHDAEENVGWVERLRLLEMRTTVRLPRFGRLAVGFAGSGWFLGLVVDPIVTTVDLIRWTAADGLGYDWASRIRLTGGIRDPTATHGQTVVPSVVGAGGVRRDRDCLSCSRRVHGPTRRITPAGNIGSKSTESCSKKRPSWKGGGVNVSRNLDRILQLDDAQVIGSRVRVKVWMFDNGGGRDFSSLHILIIEQNVVRSKDHSNLFHSARAVGRSEDVAVTHECP